MTDVSLEKDVEEITEQLAKQTLDADQTADNCANEQSPDGWELEKGDADDEGDDWEESWEKGDIQSLDPSKLSKDKEQKERVVKGRGATGRARMDEHDDSDHAGKSQGKIPSWSEIILSREEEIEESVASRPRPETSTVVARRLLANALDKPELIARGEEKVIKARREQNQASRRKKREELDAVWSS